MDSKDPANTKGVGFCNVRQFVVEQVAADGWPRVLQHMSVADREELQSVIPMGWYSLSLYARLIRAVDEVHGRGDLALIERLGRFEAQRDLTYIHRVFLKLVNPVTIIEQMGKYWRRFHDTGDWEVQRITTTQATSVLRGWGHVDPALCKELVAYMSQCLELVGAQNVTLHHPECRALGARECRFECRWSSRVSEEASR